MCTTFTVIHVKTIKKKITIITLIINRRVHKHMQCPHNMKQKCLQAIYIETVIVRCLCDDFNDVRRLVQLQNVNFHNYDCVLVHQRYYTRISSFERLSWYENEQSAYSANTEAHQHNNNNNKEIK